MKNLENLGELRNKNVVITGSTSGVGRATAEAFALQGANVVIVARGEEAIDETVSLCQDLGVQAFGISTDVSEEKEVKRVVKEVIEKLGSIDIWVNNAGVMASGKFEEIPMDINHQVIKTNLFGYLHGVYYILPYFKEREKGIIINNVSIGGFMPAPYSAVYSATKAGIKKYQNGRRSKVIFRERAKTAEETKRIQSFRLILNRFRRMKSNTKMMTTTRICPNSSPILKPKSGTKILCSFANMTRTVLAKPIP
jgi:NADP-dependent 3-hydroxy acid dehydrogenase YdfG